MKRNLTGADLISFKDNYDWQHAFYEAANGDCKSYDEIGPIQHVEEVIACDEGENDGAEWIAIVKLVPETSLHKNITENGPFAIIVAGCDYTGWDCQASGYIEYHESLEVALTDLTPEQASRLGYPHDANKTKIVSEPEKLKFEFCDEWMEARVEEGN